MRDEVYSVIVRDASLIDIEGFKDELPAEDFQVVQPALGDESHEELATILILALAGPALTALTLWLLRTHQSETIEYDVTIRQPDGTEIIVHLKIKRSASESPKSQVIKQIAEGLKIPESAILAASPR